MSLQNTCCLQIGRTEFHGLSHITIFSEKDIFACPRLGAWHVFQPLMSINFGCLFAKCILFRMEIRVETLASWNTNYGKKNSMTMNLKGAKWKMKNRQCWTQTSKSGYTPDKKKNKKEWMQKGWQATAAGCLWPWPAGIWICLPHETLAINTYNVYVLVYIYISLYNYMTSTLVP